VFRLFKLLVGLVGLAAFVWFGANIPLGHHTLFEHLQAIGRTRETQDLLEGTRETARPLVDSMRRKLAHESSDSQVATPDAGAAVRPADDISESDRAHLKKLLAGEASDHDHDHAPRSGRKLR
jgi:hypothetical protein